MRVTSAQGGTAEVLKPAERAQLEEIRKARTESSIDPNLNAVLQETKHYTVEEYLKAHPEVLDRAVQDYRVGGYDVLNIMVYEEKDLSRDAVRVSADGYITFPLAGRLKVDNMTTFADRNPHLQEARGAEVPPGCPRFGDGDRLQEQTLHGARRGADPRHRPSAGRGAGHGCHFKSSRVLSPTRRARRR